MKDVILNANFPKTPDGRVYHLGLRAGEVANRVLTVGSPSRAQAIANLLDGAPEKVFRLSSERAFLTFTGRYNGVPVSIVSIGMGFPNMDFFVREVRECVSGDLVIIRLGSCGGLTGISVGSLVVPSGSIAISRNYDFDFTASPTSNGHYHEGSAPYHFSKPVDADMQLHAQLAKSLMNSRTPDLEVDIHPEVINASADSFYSSQGRQTSFPDHNEDLLDHIQSCVPGIATLEMETFHLFHLARVWRPRTELPQGQAVPPTHLPTKPTINPGPSAQEEAVPAASVETTRSPRIRAAAVQMIFADRKTQDFISPDRVTKLERWSGEAVLKALTEFYISPEFLHDDEGSVW